MLVLMVLAASVAQLLIDIDTVNIACVCVLAWISLVTLLYVRWTDSWRTHPLSTFSLFGLCMTTQCGALLIQTAAWTPVAYALRQPFTTFATLALFQLVALGAHATYRFIPALQFGDRSSVRALLKRTAIYALPSVGMLWIFGAIGFICHFGGGGVDGDPGSKVIVGFRFLIFAPFLIPLYVQDEGAAYCRFPRKHYLWLVLYAIMVALLGVAANTRGLMLTGIVTVGLVVVLWLMRNPVGITSAHLYKAGGTVAVLATLMLPLSYLSTAMVVARQYNGPIGAARMTPVEMIGKTYQVMQQPALIAAYRLRAKLATASSRYDENYIANPMLARFVETKFHDNALFFASNLSARSEDSLERMTVNFMWGILPEPLLKGMGVKVKKADLNFSMGDYLLYLNNGYALGGRKTGSVFAQGLALFGVLFPVVYFFIAIILFALLDLLAFKNAYGRIVLTVPAMINMFRYFIAGITGESLHQVVTTATRGLLQTVLIYLLVYYVAKGLLRLFSGNSAKPAAAPA
ncbi:MULTISPECIES: hypothetical protein [unclassified Janthinobacterium]|uniref:hypothetical protein n=1 Tax=unclassified Janthinobacterium TaxID=2610881 RepID=UPI00034B79C4|nr:MULTISPECIES: hypothetical protein [unclassified Janthinobacterium]